MNIWLKRIVIAAVVFEIAYLVLVNLALRLPVTQTLLNKIRPDKFQVTWEEAWTWYPFRVHARGVSANGESRRQQWQFEFPEGTASISLLPLVIKRVSLSGIEGRDVKYYQRPRLRPDNDFAEVREFFPPIENREYSLAEPLPTGKRGWTISINDAHVTGTHEVWFYQVRGTIKGELATDFRYRTRGGPFRLRNGKFDVAMDSVYVNQTRETLSDVKLKGEVEFAEFVPRQTKGIDALSYLTLNAEVSGGVDSLAFLNLYLSHFDGMHLDGAGHIAGRVNFERGTLRAETHLDIAAPLLDLELLDHHATGDGDVILDVTAAEPDTVAGSIRFNELDAFRKGDERPLFSGDGLIVDVKGDADLFPDDGGKPHASYLALTVPAVAVPDLAVYQHYIPDNLGLRFHGGEGVLHGRAVVDHVTMHADLKLDSDDADIGIKEYRFKADVDVALLSNTDDVPGMDVGGTYIHLSDARLANEDKKEVSDGWEARVEVEQGRLTFNLVDKVAESGLLQAVTAQDARTLFEQADGDLTLSGKVSSLGWLNQLLKNDYQTVITGSSDMQARLLLQGGWPAAGTRLDVLPSNLSVSVLDYIAEGEGAVSLNLEEGGQRPDAIFNVELKDAVFRRQNEETAFIEQVQLKLEGKASDMTFDGPTENLALRLQIPKARVTDMRVYNLYLPENSPLRLLDGEADLVADVRMEPKTASGFVTLKTDKLRSRLDEQEIAGDVTANIKIIGGTPRDMDFDITGSTLLLDNVVVAGKQDVVDDTNWSARIDFTRANTVWKKPVQLNAEADIEMKDSTPIVAMLSNHRNKNGWIEKLLTVGKIEGEATVNMQKGQIIFPHAFAGSDKIDVGAKGIITKEARDGVIYARYRKLKGLLKIRDGRRNFDVIKAQEKFDDYTPQALIK
jgi:hypothetical protein